MIISHYHWYDTYGELCSIRSKPNRRKASMQLAIPYTMYESISAQSFPHTSLDRTAPFSFHVFRFFSGMAILMVLAGTSVLIRKKTVQLTLWLSAQEKNGKYGADRLPPQEILDRMEEYLLDKCIERLESRSKVLQDSDNCNIIKEIYGVPIDGTILLEALVLMSHARDTGLLFHEDGEGSYKLLHASVLSPAPPYCKEIFHDTRGFLRLPVKTSLLRARTVPLRLQRIIWEYTRKSYRSAHFF